jgi:hypothetical protein
MNYKRNTKPHHQPRVTGTVKLKGNCIKVNNLSMDEFIDTVNALECKTR